MEESSAQYYIDSNIFIFSVIDTQVLGNKCREILKKAHQGQIKGISSCLVLDEILWNLKKLNIKNYLDICKNFLDLNIKFIEVTKITLHKSLDIISKYNLKPRDSIHIATMNLLGLQKIISEDSDFDKVLDIKRVNILALKIETEEKSN